MSSKNMFEAALAAEGVQGKLADLARSVYSQESGGGKNTQTSNRGAHGGMQIIPATFKSVAEKDWSIDNPEHNARAGIRYLKQLDKMSGGDPALTAAGYYGGPGGMEKAKKGVAVYDPVNPKAPSTLEYGQQVVARMGKGGASDAAAPVTSVAVAARASPEIGRLATLDPEPAPEVPGVSLPPAVLAQLNQAPSYLPANTANGGPDAWTTFIQAMPQTRQPLNVNDLRFGAVTPAMRVPQFQFNPTPVAVQSRRPNFDAFASWAGRPRNLA